MIKIVKIIEYHKDHKISIFLAVTDLKQLVSILFVNYFEEMSSGIPAND